MQIGIDLGATKIEYVLLDNDNIELKRDRVQTPKDYKKTIITITEIVKKLEKNSGKFNVGICHPGAVDKTTGLIKNAHNSQWLNKRNLIKDLKLKMDNNFFSENDANCFVYPKPLMDQLAIMKLYLALYWDQGVVVD